MWRMLLMVNAGVVVMLYGLQHGLGWQPCLLCYPQRWCVLLLTGGACLAVLKPTWRRWLRHLMLLTAALGLALAARHFWIQSLPAAQAPACAPSLSYLWTYLPWYDTLAWLFTGSRDCHQVRHLWLGLSLPLWSLLLFIMEVMVVIYLGWWRDQDAGALQQP